jgi:hypothetical protein
VHKCVLNYERRLTRTQLLSLGSPKAKKAWQVQSATKSMLIVFFDAKGIVHHDFFPRNTIVNSDFYCDVLRHLRENVQ